MKTVDVLVVGAGPVGLATAAMLRKHGVDVRLIEKNSHTTSYSKAIGIHSRTLESMHSLDIAEDLNRQGHPMQKFQLTENKKVILESNFKGISSAYEFVLGLPQSRTEDTLHRRLAELGGSVEWNTQITAINNIGRVDKHRENATVTIQRENGEEETLACHWLIGADGSRSSVREMANIEFPGGDYGNAFILGDVKIDWTGSKNVLQFFLSSKGYLLVIPMPGGMHRIIAQTDKRYEDFQREDKPLATLKELQEIVDNIGPGDIRVHSPQWLTCAPFYHRRASEVRKGRVILAGDAFHLFSPLGAQGLNTGFQDVFNLAWKLAYIEKAWADVGLIDSYCIEREEIAKLIASVTSKTTRYITARVFYERLYRRWFTWRVAGTDRAQTVLPRLLAGLLQRYSESSPLVSLNNDGPVESGTRFPHFWLWQSGGYVPVASKIHGTKFTLLFVVRRLTVDRMSNVMQFHKGVSHHSQFLKSVVVSREIDGFPEQGDSEVEVVEDRLGELCEKAGAREGFFALIRPDGFVACSGYGLEADAVNKYFSSVNIASNVVAALSAA